MKSVVKIQKIFEEALFMKRKIHLQTQIILLLTILVIIPIVVISTISYLNLNRVTNNNINVTSGTNVQMISNIIDNLDKTSRESIGFMAEDPNAKAILISKDSPKWLTGSLNAFIKSHGGITNLYLGVKDKRMLLVPQQTLPAGFDPTSRPWYTDAISNSGKIVLTAPYYDASSGKVILSYAKAVVDASNSVVGVMALDLTLDKLSEEVGKVKLGESGYAIVIDNTGRIIASGKKDIMGKASTDLKWIPQVVGLEENKFSLVKIDGVNYDVYRQLNTSTGWQIAAIIPQKELFSEANSIRNIMIIVAILSLLLSLIIGTLYARMLSKPIGGLVGSLKRLQNGDFTEKVKYDNQITHEISDISKSINVMISNVTQILKSVVDSAEEVKESANLLVQVTEQSNQAGEEVAKAIQDIAAGATNQAQNLDDGVNTVTQLGDQVNISVNDSNNMTKSADKVKKAANEGLIVVDTLINNFKETTVANERVAAEVEILAKNSIKISSITDTITAITDQTNLLALNASIEAARAGEAGKGFAVVAEEVRKLAEQSAQSASEIYTVVNEIKVSVDSVLKRLSSSMELNKKTEDSVTFTKTSFNNISGALVSLEESVANVTDSLDLISKNKNAVIEMINEVSSISTDTAASSEEVSASSEEQSAALQEIAQSSERLQELADNLQVSVNKFKIV